MLSKIEQIATEHLDIPTLKTRNMDDLDFHEVAVWQVKTALNAAYDTGFSDAQHDRADPSDYGAVLEEISELVGGKIYHGYSGRGMYGAQCLGIVCPDPVPCIEYAAENGIRGAVYDQMGLDYIVYWPEIRA